MSSADHSPDSLSNAAQDEKGVGEGGLGFFAVTGPPFEVFPFVPRAEVEHAYRWLIEQNRLRDAVAPPDGRSDSRGDRISVLAEILQRVEHDQVMAWIVLSWLSSQLAEHIGRPAGTGWWVLRRRLYPPAEEMVGFAEQMNGRAQTLTREIRRHTGLSAARSPQPDLFEDVTLVAGQAREVADEILNDVCRGRRPLRVRSIGGEPVQWAVRALAGALILLRGGASRESQVVVTSQRPCKAIYGPEHD